MYEVRLIQNYEELEFYFKENEFDKMIQFVRLCLEQGHEVNILKHIE
jgi:hypothetical protein